MDGGGDGSGYLQDRRLLRRGLFGRWKSSSSQRRLRQTAHLPVGRGVAASAEGGRHRPLQHGYHLRRLRKRGGNRESLALRHHPANHRGLRVADDRGGTEAAGAGPEPVHRRRLPGSANPEGQDHSRVTRHYGEQPARALRWNQASEGNLVPHHRRGPCPRSRRPVLRVGRQSSLPFGRLLCPGKPRGDETDRRQRLPGHVGPPRGGLSGTVAGNPAQLRPGRGEQSNGGRPDPRHFQLGLL